MKLKQLIQAEVEGKAAIAQAKKAARDLFAMEARTPEQDAALKAAMKNIDGLEDAQAGIEANLAIARRLQEEERAQRAQPIGRARH